MVSPFCHTAVSGANRPVSHILPQPFLANASRFSVKPSPLASRLTLVKPPKKLQAIASGKTRQPWHSIKGEF